MRLPRYGRSFKRVLYAPITIIGLAVLLVFLARAAVGAYLNEQRNKASFSNLQMDAGELTERERFLSEEIERLESPRGLEEEIRNKFPVAKEGENMVIIVGSENDDSGVSTEGGGFWSTIRAFFR